MADAKLLRMDRARFTSPVAQLDAVKFNIQVLAAKAGLEFEDPMTAVSFKGSVGAYAPAYTITINSNTYNPDVNGVAVAVLPSGEAVSFTAKADGYVDITGSITPEGINQIVYLTWAAAPKA